MLVLETDCFGIIKCWNTFIVYKNTKIGKKKIFYFYREYSFYPYRELNKWVGYELNLSNIYI